MENSHAIPIMPIENEITERHRIRLRLKREDLIHPDISGNKWWKLKYNIEAAISSKKTCLLTFGGAYSNHLLATAAVGYAKGLKTIGIVRGEKIEPLNPTLDKVSNKYKMRLIFINRTAYREKNVVELLREIGIEEDEVYTIPEGGTNALAIKGCKEILNGIGDDSDFICCSCGTGGTISGLIAGAHKKKFILGFSALKGDFLINDVSQLLKNEHHEHTNNWEIRTDYHFGGYAKFNPDLIDFINQFKDDFNISLDPIYTGKMMYGIFDLIDKGFFPENSTITAIHSGGLQGILGFNQRFGNLLK